MLGTVCVVPLIQLPNEIEYRYSRMMYAPPNIEDSINAFVWRYLTGCNFPESMTGLNSKEAYVYNMLPS